MYPPIRSDRRWTARSGRVFWRLISLRHLSPRHLFAWPLRLSLIVLSCLNVQAQSLDSGCDLVDELQRVDSNRYLLAVRQGQQWLICRSGNERNSPYAMVLERLADRGELNNIEFRWAVPSSNDRHVVYASTIVNQNQPISLFRNGSSLLDALFLLFGRNDEGLQPVAEFDVRWKQTFVNHHTDSSSNSNTAIEDWHDTALWMAADTNAVVTSTLLALPAGSGRVTERGAERLIRVQGNRPYVSWIPFRSQPPDSTNQSKIIAVTLAYSGDIGETFRPYRFYFLAR